MPEKGGPGLPDYVAPGMRVLFVGINPGLRSAQLGHHFAGHSNRFWKLLADSKLIPIPLTYQDDFRLLEWGIGLTNLVARPTAGIHELSTQEYREGRTILFKMIEVYRPQIIALLGLGITKILFEESESQVYSGAIGRKVKPGLYPVLLQKTPVFVLPNPSGRNAHYSYQAMRHWFQELGTTIADLSARKDW